MTREDGNGSDDYLWDRSGQPDADVALLERALGNMDKYVPIPLLARLPAAKPRRASRLVLAGFAAAAAVVLAVGGAVLRVWLTPWTVTALQGQPRLEHQAILSPVRVNGGEVVETDKDSRASLRVGVIGLVEIEPGSRVQVVAMKRWEHRLDLKQGRLRAVIDAPPRWFVVDTPGAAAIDLGCTYTLDVDSNGGTTLRVEEGWVQLDDEHREAIVPAGAAAHARAGHGPGSPYYQDASDAFRQALATVDFETGNAADSALRVVLAAARPRDSLTLLSLLRRPGAAHRAEIYTRLAMLLPPPQGVTREAILAGDSEALDRWWEALALERPRKLYPRLWGFGS